MRNPQGFQRTVDRMDFIAPARKRSGQQAQHALVGKAVMAGLAELDERLSGLGGEGKRSPPAKNGCRQRKCGPEELSEGEAASSYAETGRADAAADPEPDQAWQIGISRFWAAAPHAPRLGFPRPAQKPTPGVFRAAPNNELSIPKPGLPPRL